MLTAALIAIAMSGQPEIQEAPTFQVAAFEVVITKAEYSKLKLGMSYSQVVAIIGEDGEEMSASNVAGISTIMYSWKNWNGSNAILMFQNGKLVTKNQFGLK